MPCNRLQQKCNARFIVAFALQRKRFDCPVIYCNRNATQSLSLHLRCNAKGSIALESTATEMQRKVYRCTCDATQKVRLPCNRLQQKCNAKFIVAFAVQRKRYDCIGIDCNRNATQRLSLHLRGNAKTVAADQTADLEWVCRGKLLPEAGCLAELCRIRRSGTLMVHVVRQTDRIWE